MQSSVGVTGAWSPSPTVTRGFYLGLKCVNGPPKPLSLTFANPFLFLVGAVGRGAALEVSSQKWIAAKPAGEGGRSMEGASSRNQGNWDPVVEEKASRWLRR